MKGEIPWNLYFTYFCVYADCIKGKLAISNRKTVSECLEHIHIDICEELHFTCISCKKIIYDLYWLLLIFQLYLYITWKMRCFRCKAKVENQLNRKIKVVRYNRGVEDYGRYDEMGQNLSSLARFLE